MKASIWLYMHAHDEGPLESEGIDKVWRIAIVI